jgi:hypothetical protein
MVRFSDARFYKICPVFEWQKQNGSRFSRLALVKTKWPPNHLKTGHICLEWS